MGKQAVKALTIRQPYAGLIATHRKTIETRPWRTSRRGRIAIHAGQAITASPLLLTVTAAASEAHISPPDKVRAYGAVVATAELVDCIPTDEWWATPPELAELHVQGGLAWDIAAECQYGDYSPGRYGWLLGDVRTCGEPQPARGRQGLWEWEPPAESCPTCMGRSASPGAFCPWHVQ